MDTKWVVLLVLVAASLLAASRFTRRPQKEARDLRLRAVNLALQAGLAEGKPVFVQDDRSEAVPLENMNEKAKQTHPPGWVVKMSGHKILVAQAIVRDLGDIPDSCFELIDH